jgi:hypothetical protein
MLSMRSRNAFPDKPTISWPSAIKMRPIASSGLRWPVAGVEAMRILTRSSLADFEKAHRTHLIPESSSAIGQAEKKLGGWGLHFDFRSARNGYGCNA